MSFLLAPAVFSSVEIAGRDDTLVSAKGEPSFDARASYGHVYGRNFELEAVLSYTKPYTIPAHLFRPQISFRPFVPIGAAELGVAFRVGPLVGFNRDSVQTQTYLGVSLGAALDVRYWFDDWGVVIEAEVQAGVGGSLSDQSRYTYLDKGATLFAFSLTPSIGLAKRF